MHNMCDLRLIGVEIAVAALHQGAPGQMTTALVPPCLLLCFGNSVNRKWKCYHIWPLYLFYYFIFTVSAGRWRSVFWGPRLKKVVNFFLKKSASGWPGLRIFWPWNDLAPLLRWRRHWEIELKIYGRTKVLRYGAIRDTLLCNFSALLHANSFGTSIRASSWGHGGVSSPNFGVLVGY